MYMYVESFNSFSCWRDRDTIAFLPRNKEDLNDKKCKFGHVRESRRGMDSYCWVLLG